MINLDRMFAAVVGCISLLSPGTRAVQARAQLPVRVADEDAIITIKVARGPTLRPGPTVQRDEAVTLRWRLLDDTSGARVGIAVCGARFWIDTAIGATIEESRDALLERLTGTAQTRAVLPGVTITADGTDSILFDASDLPGRLFHPVRIGAPTLVSLTTTAIRISESAWSSAVMVVELQSFVAGGGPDALSLLSDVNQGMPLDGAVSIRHDFGVSYAGADEPVDLTTLAGAGWQSRASVRWRLGMASYKSLPIDIIESIEGRGLIVYDGNTAIEVPSVEVET